MNTEEEIGISLGWRCQAAAIGAQLELRKKRIDGYKTCPFDIMVSNYIGMCKCIEDDFKYFCDPEYLVLKQEPQHVGKYFRGQTRDQMWIYNTYYNFTFNHESPGHGKIYLNENWPGGINHYVNNNFEKFIERYTDRINNFRNYLKNYKNINFLLLRYNGIPYELIDILKNKYPETNFKIYVAVNLPDERHVTNRGTFEELIHFEREYLTYLNITEEEFPEEHARYTGPFKDYSNFKNDYIQILNV
jgi:hypothetical protein